MYTIGEAEIQAAAEIIRSGKLFRYQGETESQTDLFEQEWAAKIGVKHALAVTSGTASLICALSGLGVGPGDEVIVPAYTFIASALAPLAVGAVPIIAEIDESLTLDPTDVEAKITPRTKAIMPVHMNGLNADMDAIMGVATRHDLLVVEDSCQADGGSYKGKRLGSIGHAGGFSFNFFKVISCGEGGAMVTSDPSVYERASLFHDGGCVFFKEGVAGQTPIFAGWNFRFNEILSSILRVQLTRLDGLLDGLRADKRQIREGLEGCGGFTFNRVNDPAGECAVTLSVCSSRPATRPPPSSPSSPRPASAPVHRSTAAATSTPTGRASWSSAAATTRAATPSATGTATGSTRPTCAPPASKPWPAPSISP